jgi:nucleotide-binding universal stress UspA family protein
MNGFPNKILLATDGSEDAALAASAAIGLSNRTASELHVVHTWQSVPSARFESFIRSHSKQQAEELLAEQEKVIEASGGKIASTHLREGRAIDEILDLAGELEAGLIVMGSRGMGPLKRLAVGSVSEGVVHHARCPVLVLRGGDEAWPPKRVVAGDDGSEGARRAEELAAGIAALFGAEMVLARAHRNPPDPIGGWSGRDRRRFDEARSKELEYLNGRAEAIEGAIGRRPNARVVDADATLALLEVAEEGDEGSTLIALGSRGLGMIGRARLGSVSTNVLRAARGPVLIHALPTGEAAPSATQERAPERVLS